MNVIGMSAAILLAALVAEAGGKAAMAEDAVIMLRVTGEDGATVRGRCTLVRQGQDEILEIQDKMPFERHLDGEALRCEFVADGAISVELSRNGASSSASSSGGRVNVNIG